MASFPYRHVGKACDVEDLVIQGRGATPHPIHIHVNHFQVIESTANSNDFRYWGEAGDWRDTMPALSGATRVRYVLDKYGGNIMMHCHFLMHEDVGMMDRIWVEPSDASDSLRCTATSQGSVVGSLSSSLLPPSNSFVHSLDCLKERRSTEACNNAYIRAWFDIFQIYVQIVSGERDDADE